MTLRVNGDVMMVERTRFVSDLLVELGYGEAPRVAVAVNGRMVRRQEYAATALAADDRVEVLAPMAGG